MSNKDAVKPNAQQQQVIDTVDGAVLVVAGAGTGKTATVVKRIEKELQEIENYPISWSYYKLQEVKFTSDFESLVIFKDDKYLNID